MQSISSKINANTIFIKQKYKLCVLCPGLYLNSAKCSISHFNGLMREPRFHHANHQTTYATAEMRVALMIHSRTVNASINVHNCFLFTTFKCFIMLYEFIIILVSSCLEFLVCTRCLITSNTRASCHACANTDN